MSIIVIGAGLAGFISGITALKRGYQVVILEKMSRFGGNSIKASSGINLIDSQVQRDLDISDSVNAFLSDTFRSAQKSPDSEWNPELVQLLALHSPQVEQLLKEIGVELNQVTQCGGHRVARTHTNKSQPGIGFYLVKHAHDYFVKLGGSIKYSTEAYRLITEEDQVIGVETNTGDIYNGSVIIATGGYERSLVHLNKYNSDLIGRPTTAGAHCTGDGLKLGTEIGADLIGMYHLQVHPTGIIDPADPDNLTKFLAPEALRGVGGKLYSLDDQPLGSELETRDVVTAMIEQQPLHQAKLVLDQDARYQIETTVSFYQSKGLCTVEDGKTTFIVTPVIHYTMGGLRINEKAQVIRAEGSVIEGLYAVGEVTGGVHGSNRLAGNSLLECCVFGIIAGSMI
jgi:succinate dehydrogenase/fumarate reductase flavoprotein subunit